MRKLGIGINLVAMLALVSGTAPTSAIASLFSNNCKMACCEGQPAHKPIPKVGDCAGDCAKAKSAQSTNSLPSTEVKEKQADKCVCSIGSAPSSPKPIAIATSTASVCIPIVDAILEPVANVISMPIDGKTNPGSFGSDSGPPVSRPKYVSLGRAPPVA